MHCLNYRKYLNIMRLSLARCLLFILPVIIYIIIISVHITKPTNNHQINETSEVKLLLEQLFDSSTTLNNVQLCWNRLINIWKIILFKFLHDACNLCHSNDIQCSKSVNINRYIDYINKSFYPIDNTKRPDGMGIYYDFDLKSMRSLNNSILSNDVTPCDYFHILQLMIHVQTVFHEKQIEYFLTKGTFMGSLRHHDIIPWDTDIDIFIPHSDVITFKNSFGQLSATADGDDIDTDTGNNSTGPLYRKDLVVYQFRNTHRVTSYKIFSTKSPRVNRTHYRWPKIDVFPYRESRTHIFAFPRHKHNLGTMNYLAKNDVQPTHLRPLGPLLVPSPRNLRSSLKAMVQLGRSSVFHVCEGNTFLHRQNRASTETWRVPCQILSTSYPFVESQRNQTSGICTEMLLFNNQKRKLSLFKYKCDEHLPRTLK